MWLVVPLLAADAAACRLPATVDTHPGSEPMAAVAAVPLPASVSAEPDPNPWADLTRDVLAQHCGRCHRHDLPTSLPNALAVFDLLERPWYARLKDDQFDGLLRRVKGMSDLPSSDAVAVEKFVRCARDRDCADPDAPSIH